MADRILKRPMFRRGGSTNEGIMSGLVDRRGYAEGDKVGNEQDWNWMDESGLGKSLKFAGNLAMDIPSSVIDTGIFTPINQASRFLLGSNPGLSMNKVQESIKKGIFGKDAEIYDPNNPDVFYHDEDADPNITEFFGYNTDATPTGIFADKEEVPTSNIKRPGSDAEGKRPSDMGKIEQVNNSSGQPISAADDIKTVYEDLLPLLQSTLGVDDSELNRQKYLELAKFGANLMAQPGGSLTRAIGKAAEDPLAGMTRIAETQRKGKRIPAEIAMKIALSEGLSSSELGKQIKDLKKLYPQKKGESSTEYNKRIGDKAMRSGTATREATAEGRVQNNTKLLIDSEIFDSEFAAGKVGRAIANTGKDISHFELMPKDKEDYKEGQHYFSKKGELHLYDGKNILTWNPKTSKFE